MVCCKDVLAQATSWTENTLHVWVWVNTCPNSYVLLENIPNWPVGPSSAEDVLAAFPLPGRDATETLPAVEAPVDTHGLRWPPEVKNNPDIIAVKSCRSKTSGMRIPVVFVYLQIIQKRTSEVHLSQGHVRMTAVQKALDLSADVQS